MENPGLCIRPGRTWRLNPAYREALLALCAGASSPPDAEQAGVLDVLGVEVDGVDLATGVREDDLFRVVGDLARAAERLVRGAPKASVTFGATPVELLFVRTGASVLLSLVVLGPPPEVRVRDLEVDASRFFDAVRECIEAVLADLREVAPALERGRYGASLTAAVRHLRSRRVSAPAPDPGALPPAGPSAGGARRTEGAIACGFELLDDGDQLASVADDAEGDLHSLLAPGRIHLHAARGGEIAGWEGPPFLAFRALLPELRELLLAWEQDDPRGRLLLGEAEIQLDLAADRVRGPNGASRAPAPAVAAAIARAALDFCAAVISRAPAQRSNPYLADLAADAEEIHAHCHQLLDGDVTARRPPRHGTVTRGSERSTSSRPLSSFRIRRLSWERRWSFDAGPLLPGGLGLLGRRLLVAGEDGTFALDRATGLPAFSREPAQSLWLGPRRADPVLVAGPMGLDLVTPGGATAWTAPTGKPAGAPVCGRYLKAPERLVASVDGRSVTGFSEADGTVAWRFVPPGARWAALCGGPGGAIVACDTGFAYGVDPVSGRVRWRVRTGVVPSGPPLPLGHHVLVTGESSTGPAVAVLDALTGAEARVHALPIDAAGVPVAFGGRVCVPGRIAGEAAAVVVRPGLSSGDAVGRFLLDDLEGLPRLLPARGRLFAADARGTVAAFDGRGEPAWTHALPHREGAQAEAPVLASARGVLLVVREGPLALEPTTGEMLGGLALPEPFAARHLVTDDRLDLVAADEDGSVHAVALGTHLSLVS